MTRKQFLIICVFTLMAAGILLASVPFVASWSPNPKSVTITIVDVAKIPAGGSKLIESRGMPIMIYKPDQETANYLVSLNTVANGPNYTLENMPEYFIYVALSTHLGCMLKPAEAYGYNGLIDPCHRGFWDVSGRLIPSAHAGEGLENLTKYNGFRKHTDTELWFQQ